MDRGHPEVRALAARLRGAAPDERAYARTAFEWVRDEVTHSMDAGDARVTWRASDVLRERTGLCYAKAHLLAALLRAEGVPTGLCYQVLADDESGHVVHGLVAVRVDGASRWSRLDPRGNKPGVDAQFSLDEERLAFEVRPELGERDDPTVYAAPHPAVLAALQGAVDAEALCRHGLPQRLD